MAERKKRYVESIHSRVIFEWSKIVNIPNGMRKEFDVYKVRYIAMTVLHSVIVRRCTGSGAKTMALTVKVSYKFWMVWLGGKHKLADFNKKTGNNIMLLQDRTLRMTDMNSLCCFSVRR
ncbi:hypothetical protein Aduo_008682 [Ancylostoma duodenale]